MANDGTFRLFLAIDPPEAVLREIADIQKRLQKLVAGNIRWVKPEGMHLTLKFFGDALTDDIRAISAACVQEAAQEAPFILSFCGMGTFPTVKRPRVLYLGLEGETMRLADFQSRLENRLSEMGFTGEDRHFTPHLTLARIKELREPEKIAKEAAEILKYATKQFTAREMVLFKSDLSPGGAVYTKLAGCPFAVNMG
jgi:2'-5' RNA ligase